MRLFIAMALLATIVGTANAESLFRASADMQVQHPYTPVSLIGVPMARAVGDTLTIQIAETAKQTTNGELKVTRTHAVEENGTGLFNGMIDFMADKVPFLGKYSSKLHAPSFDGMDNSNVLSSKAESSRSTALTDMVTCQVVQILPNGQLMVQGRKTIDVNRDRQDIYVSGIVNPFYLDKNNTVKSTMVGNFQMIQGGKGVVSRQQSDGIANKIYQFFN